MTASFDEFLAIDMRLGRIVEAAPNARAHKPAFALRIDFGPEIGIKTSSAQITDHYTCDELVGRLVIGVVNFPPRQIARVLSEVLVLGFADADGAIVLAQPERPAPLGARLC